MQRVESTGQLFPARLTRSLVDPERGNFHVRRGIEAICVIHTYIVGLFIILGHMLQTWCRQSRGLWVFFILAFLVSHLSPSSATLLPYETVSSSPYTFQVIHDTPYHFIAHTIQPCNPHNPLKFISTAWTLEYSWVIVHVNCTFVPKFHTQCSEKYSLYSALKLHHCKGK